MALIIPIPLFALWFSLGVTLIHPASPQSALVPAAVNDSAIYLRLTHLGTMPASSFWGSKTNATSPVAVASDLILIDQQGYLYRRDVNGVIHTLLTPGDAPAELSLINERILNVAPNHAGDLLYVVFTSSTTPAGVPAAVSPRTGRAAYQVIYSYRFDGTSLSDPRPVRSFEVNIAGGHTGGGLIALDDGSILLAVGDNGDSSEDGRTFAQDNVSHLSKIVRIAPQTGDWTILAKGIRNAQRLEVYQRGENSYLSFVDIGRDVAEELNRVLLSDLLDSSTIENFGWGRNAADGRAREGTFYIDPSGNAVDEAPVGEAGFSQPLAQWGRETQSHVAATGPVSNSMSFRTIDVLFGDLPSGTVYAIRDTTAGIAPEVLRVNLLDDGLQATSLKELAGGRPDPRFFKFPDGAAGVLLERSGDLYGMAEITAE